MRRLARCVPALLPLVVGCFEDPAEGSTSDDMQTSAATSTSAGTTTTTTTTTSTPPSGTSTTPASSSTTESMRPSSGEPASTTQAPPPSTTAADAGTTTGEVFFHVLFTTQAQFTGGQIGSLEDADALCTAAADDGRPYMAVLSDSTRSPADRIEIVGPVMNTLGQEVAADARELWSGLASAEVGYDQGGAPIPASDLAWVGSTEESCQDWNTEVFEELGAFGVPTDPALWLLPENSFQCGLDLHLYCISIPQ